MHLVLIGLRGAGKTTIGRLLADRVHQPFIDLDDLVLRRLGAVSVRAVFESRGESAWREAERDACLALLAAPLAPSIIALGGGAPMLDDIAFALPAARRDGRALVAHLRCPPTIAGERLARVPGDRTSLTGRGMAEELEELARLREPRYAELADFDVDASGSPDRVVDLLEDRASQAARSSQR